jgi:hypothetical protein
MKTLANLMLFFAATDAVLVFSGIVLKIYWSVFMIGWGMF